MSLWPNSELALGGSRGVWGFRSAVSPLWIVCVLTETCLRQAQPQLLKASSGAVGGTESGQVHSATGQATCRLLLKLFPTSQGITKHLRGSHSLLIPPSIRTSRILFFCWPTFIILVNI